MDAPKPHTSIEAEPVIPYVEEADYPDELMPLLDPYRERMGFVPNALKLYMHRPEIAGTLWTLNNNIMRDPSSTLDQNLKRRLSAVCSTINGCAYCTAHTCSTLKNDVNALSEGWGMSEEDLQALVKGDLEPRDGMEAACFAYVRAASTDPSNVADEILQNLNRQLSPPQVVELASVVGFWKMYNTIHDSLHIPVEQHLLGDTGYVDL